MEQTFGPFLVSSSDRLVERLSSSPAFCGYKKDSGERLLKSSPMWISVSVDAGESLRAQEIAEKRFRLFEDLMRFIIWNPENAGVWVFNEVGAEQPRGFVFRDECFLEYFGVAGNSGGAYSVHNPCFFRNPVFAWLWKAAGKHDLKAIEKRIFDSVVWLGRAVVEKEDAKSLILGAIALETAFGKGKTNEALGPSISDRLADCAAFVMSENPEERQSLASDVKKIYSVRSALVHGTNKSIPKKYRKSSLSLIRKAVCCMAKRNLDGEFADEKSFDEWLKGKVYA